MGGHHWDRVLLGEQSIGRVSVATCLVRLGTFAQCTDQELGSFQRPSGSMWSCPFQFLEAACTPLLVTLILHLHTQPQSDPSCILTFLCNDNQEKFPTFKEPHD